MFRKQWNQEIRAGFFAKQNFASLFFIPGNKANFAQLNTKGVEKLLQYQERFELNPGDVESAYLYFRVPHSHIPRLEN